MALSNPKKGIIKVNNFFNEIFPMRAHVFELSVAFLGNIYISHNCRSVLCDQLEVQQAEMKNKFQKVLQPAPDSMLNFPLSY